MSYRLLDVGRSASAVAQNRTLVSTEWRGTVPLALGGASAMATWW